MIEQDAASGLFEARRTHRLTERWSTYQPHNPIASDLHDCDRYQTMRLVAWKVREQPDVRGMEVMEDGNVLERSMIAQLLEEGWEIVEQQAPFEVLQPLEPGGTKRRILSGRMDGKIRIDGKLLPIEFKSTSEWNLESLESEEDLKTRSEWTRKWWRQLQIYMLGGGYEQAVLVLGFRGRRRVIVVSLDYDEAERILQVATRAVANQSAALDDGIDESNIDSWLGSSADPGYHHDPVVCGRCPFNGRACYPPKPAAGAQQLRPDLEDLVQRVIDAKPFASDYKKAHKELVAQTTGTEFTVAGRYVVKGQWTTRSLKAQPAKLATVQKFWSPEIVGQTDEKETE